MILLRLIFLPIYKFQFFMSNALGVDNKNNSKLRSLKNKHKGETIFIIGNGPSLTPEILSKIKGKTCLASNKIYLMFQHTDWRPNYYSVEDDLVLKNNISEINEYNSSLKLLPIHSIFHIGKVKDAIYFNYHGHHFYPDKPKFSSDVLSGIYWGGSVVYTQIQLAIFLGAKKIVLLGVDFSFSIPKKNLDSSKEIISEGEVNHFSKMYRKPGEKWNKPNLDLQEKGYESVIDNISKFDAEVYNSTNGSKLHIIQKMDIDQILSKEKPS